jgi:hypothetical protein
MIFQVSQEVINKAEFNRKQIGYNQVTDCLIATAVKEVLPNSKVICGAFSMSIDAVEYKLPTKAIDEIGNFLNKQQIEPFEFELKE